MNQLTAYLYTGGTTALATGFSFAVLKSSGMMNMIYETSTYIDKEKQWYDEHDL